MFYNFYSRKNRFQSGRFFIFLIIGIIFSFIFVNKVDSARIALTPLVFELTTEKGQITEEYIRVMNPSYESLITVRMEVEDIFPEGEEGRVKLEIPKEERDPFSLSSWITFEPEVFTLQPREERPIKFIINIPQYAEPGGHYAGILARTEVIEGSEGVGVGIIQRIASLILLTVPGEIKEDLSVVGFETSRSYYEFGPIDFSVRFENKGTVHLRPESTIIITNFLGQKVVEIPVEIRNVLPGSIRKFEVEWPQKWLFGGRYTASLTGVYGKANNPLYFEEIIFWVFPWKIGGGILLFLILALIFFFLTRKRWRVAFKILIKGESALSEKKKG